MALFSFVNKARLDQALTENKSLKEELSSASRFVEALKSADFQASFSGLNENSVLGESLHSLRSRMITLSKEEQQRNWVNQGLAKFADLLRVTKQENATVLFDHVISSLVAYLDVNQGAIFLINDEHPGDPFIELVSCYAYHRKKHLDKRIELGGGLVGQCFLEKQVIYLTEVPADYIRITSGLGEALPRSILLVPMMLDDQVLGVTELASFNVFEPYQIDFVKKIADNMASTFAGARTSMRTQALLTESQFQAEQLRAQEEEMRQNMEELTATQEEMQRKANEVLNASAEMRSILNGIDATMATIEFTPEGVVTTANTNFLNAMKYSLAEIKGKHHRLFTPPDVSSSQEYQHFWTSLAAGKSNTDVFRRIDSNGKTVWLNAIYNPILDADGKVLKVIKFATDITAQKESEIEVKHLLEESKAQGEELRQTMEEISATQEEMQRKSNEVLKSSAEMTSILNGINATMATIEFTKEGVITNANEIFLRTMGYSLSEIKGKHHRLFMPDELLRTSEYEVFWPNLAAGKSNTDVFKRVSSTGKTVWLNAIYNPILGMNGEVLKVMKFATDITRQKQKELEVQELLEESKAQEEELRQTMEEITATQEEMVRKSEQIQQAAAERESLLHGMNSTMATIEFTVDGTVLDANPIFLSLMKYSLDEIKGKHHRIFVPQEFREGTEYKTFWNHLAEGRSVTDVFKRINSKGEAVWMNAIYNPIFNSQGEVLKIMKLATDVTSSKLREADLDRANTLLSLITKTTTEGLWDMDVPADLQFNDDTPFNWYERFRSMLGFDGEKSFPNVLHSWSSRLHPDHKHQTLLAFEQHLKDFTGKTPYDVEYQLQLKNGTYRWFRAVGNTLRDEKGFPRRVAGSLIDIHHLKG